LKKKQSSFAKDEVEPMRNRLRRRFWLETSLALVSSSVFILTVVHRDWIESVFGIDPDQGNGTLEWLIVGTVLVVSLALFTLASHEWRRIRAAISS
jgi:hypothetical protein